MPSSYTVSIRLTLQATGENNNTWGVILNNGVFGLVDYAIAGRLAFTLSGIKTLTTGLGVADEARVAFLDVTGGAGGQINLPAVSKGYFTRNASAGDLLITAGGAISATLAAGDIGPLFTDGANTYPLSFGGVYARTYIDNADAALKAYVDAAIAAAASINLPSPIGNLGKALVVTMAGAPPAETWMAGDYETAVAWALTL